MGFQRLHDGFGSSAVGETSHFRIARQGSCCCHPSWRIPLLEKARSAGITTLAAMSRHLNELGVPAARGGARTATPIRRIWKLQLAGRQSWHLELMGHERGKLWRLYETDADGGHMHPLLDETRNEADPSWMPDGNAIVFGRPPDVMAERAQS